MTCERCDKFRRLVSFYDQQTDATVTLCEACFKWFANGRRKGGLPIPNARKITKQVAASVALCVLLVMSLAACSDDNGGEQVNSQGVQKCTITVNGQEKPCH